MSTPTPEVARRAFTAWKAAVGHNLFQADPHLASLLAHHGHADGHEALEAFGARCATDLDALARVTNEHANLPRLERYDGIGTRTEGVAFHPAYHELGRAVYATGVMSLYAEPGHELGSIALLYLLAQNGEAGHCCPLACTAGMIKILQATEAPIPPTWLPRLLDPDYDTHFHGSQFLTEVQGGSDVGVNAVVARADGETWRLYGEKWFCSVIDANLFLVTARPEEAPGGTRGLAAYVVPRVLDGAVNGFSIRRLKDKLGTRSMASAEVDFEGARGWFVGDFRTVLDVVINTSRLYNAVCSCGMLQRAWLEACHYAANRTAFGQPILALPPVARIVARLRTEAYAARASTFAVAALSDRKARGQLDDTEAGGLRMLTNLNKYWTSQTGTTAVRDAIEVLGGNGTIEEFSVLPRLLRDSVVCEAWEGGHNVLCAQVLRDARRLRLHEPMFAWLEHLPGDPHRLQAARERFDQVLALDDATASLVIRDVIDELRPVVQERVLRAEALRSADPAVAVAADHLLAISDRSWDPLRDATFAERLARLNRA